MIIFLLLLLLLLSFSFLRYPSCNCISNNRHLQTTESPSLGPSQLQQDIETLLAVKTALQHQDGARISSLLSTWQPNDTSPCLWYGVHCSTLDGQTRVNKLVLSGSHIKASLDPGFFRLGALESLNLSGNCFEGPLPSAISFSALSELDISGNFMSGLIPANFWTNLTGLQLLDISGNNFTGDVINALPANCGKLQAINFSGNFFSGSITTYPWVDCVALTKLDLSSNNIGGVLPAILGRLPSLEEVVLCSNWLTGVLPNELFSPLSKLRHVDLSANMLNGAIPPHIGNSSRTLERLFLAENKLNGSLPPELGKLSGLISLLLGNNAITAIPSEITNCTSLLLLDLSSNRLSGLIPSFLGEMRMLKYLILHSNQLTGKIPVEFSSLLNLQSLDLSNNSLSGEIPGHTLMANLSNIRFLLLANNYLFGPIPLEVGNMSQLQFLDFSSNILVGEIPSELGQLTDLLWLMLAHNELTGEIPSELGNCSSLLWFNTRSNRLSGSIPFSVANMGINPEPTFRRNLIDFNPPRAEGICLMLMRWIPEDYPPFSFQYSLLDRSHCQQLWRNLVTGIIPLSACNNHTNKYGGFFQVTDNNIGGHLPPCFQANRTALLLLSNNLLTGPLPPSLRDVHLIALNVSHNTLNDSIPDSLGHSNCLNMLDLSYNNFSGTIPTSLEELNQLIWFNVSYNPLLSGEVPNSDQFSTFTLSSYYGNPNLCFQRATGARAINTSSKPPLPYCGIENTEKDNASLQARSRFKLVYIILLISGACILGILLFAAALRFLTITHRNGGSFLQKQKQQQHYMQDIIGDSDGDGDETSSTTTGGMNLWSTSSTVRIFDSARSSQPPCAVINNLTYADVLAATNNFDETNVVGSGGFGVVYRANMRDGSTVAVKKLTKSGMQGEREFLAEMSTLGNHMHENLVPLLGCCIFGSERMLVYKFLHKGSLEDCLYSYDRPLDWSRRLGIACGAARGLLYLHEECSPAVIHRDLKASNILLDDKFQAHLTDFGLARELDPSQTHVSTIIAGTLGYVPPEYGKTWRATIKGDIYSFGVVLLELVTGKHPLNPDNTGDACNLVEWVQMMLLRATRGIEAVDPRLRDGDSVELLEFLELGSLCTNEDPEKRPSTKEVDRCLHRIQELHYARLNNTSSPPSPFSTSMTSSFSDFSISSKTLPCNMTN